MLALLNSSALQGLSQCIMQASLHWLGHALNYNGLTIKWTNRIKLLLNIDPGCMESEVCWCRDGGYDIPGCWDILNSCLAEFILGNIKVYFHFTQFLDTGTSKVVWIHFERSLEYLHCTWSMSWLLMTWWCKEPYSPYKPRNYRL